MLKSLKIASMRGIRAGTIADLSSVNLFMGRNNTGKSTILEALCLLGSSLNSMEELLRRRGWIGPVSCAFLFHGDETSLTVQGTEAAIDGEISVSVETTRVRSAKYAEHLKQIRGEEPSYVEFRDRRQEAKGSRIALFGISKDGRKLATWVESTTAPEPRGRPNILIDSGMLSKFGDFESAYSQAVDWGVRDAAEALLRPLVPGLVRLEILKVGDTYVLHQILKDRKPIPIYFAGDGFKKLVLFALLCSHAKGGWTLLEEPECYQHSGWLDVVCKVIVQGVKNGMQFFISSHSLELVDRLLEAAEGDAEVVNSMALYSLKLVNGEMSADRTAGPDIKLAREDLAMDLRG